MRRNLPFFLVLALVLSACGLPSNSETFLDDDRIKISTSIASIQWLVDQIGGEHVQTQSLTTSGDDPHTYEPSPAQMTAIAVSDLYLSVGVEFEAVWLPKFMSANDSLEIIDITEGVERIPGVEHEHGEHDHDEVNSHGGLDPHVWLSPANMEQIARNVTAILENVDSQNAPVFQSNLENIIGRIDDIDRQVTQLLSEPERREFLVIHPSLGYLVVAYRLVMIPVEVDGQEPSPTQLAEILAASQTYGIHTLFTQPGTSPLNVQTFATQAGINEIIEIDPLTYDWEANMLFIAESLKGALN